MNGTWQSDTLPDQQRIGVLGYSLIALRGGLLSLLVLSGLIILLLVRLVERPVWGLHRPLTPHITQMVCKGAFVILGIKRKVRGQQMRQKGAVVANHSSWLDIFVLNASKRVYFVSKSEVANWPLIGWLARATGTVFIRRDARDARVQKTVFEKRLKVGHKLLFFPEGTSTDGRRVLQFKSTLYAAFFTPKLREILSIQPVTVIYRAPPGCDTRYYGWWGDMDFGSHFLQTLAGRRQGSVEVIYHAPVAVSDFADRKALARYCEKTVRSAMPAEFSQ